ncbi:hypothetical protein F5Y05DRAFT_373017 [Hypoxylon sp. FL0543]|nr:hypothetical protein F5Y05DRAFT_373017 [Hypoxylon sp. FL0543]
MQQIMDYSTHFEFVSPAKEEAEHIPPGDPSQSHGLKRNGTTHDENSNAKRVKYQWPLPASPSSSPLQTLRATKSRNVSKCDSFSNTGDYTLGEYDASKGQNVESECPWGRTTMNQLIPYLTVREKQFEDQLDHNLVEESANQLYELNSPFFTEDNSSVTMTFPGTLATTDASQNLSSINPAGMPINGSPTLLEHLAEFDSGVLREDKDEHNQLPKESAGPANLNSGVDVDLEGEYPLDDDLMEEDIACLLDAAMDNVQEAHVPPSSITQAWDQDSRSAAEYDSTLQYSSPLSSTGKPNNPQVAGMTEKRDDGEYDLLDEDVDWNAVYAMTSTVSRDPSAAGFHGVARPPLRDKVAYTEKPVEHNPHVKNDAMRIKPFIRPPFPEKARDRSAVAGLSSNTVLRTCFRIGEMINQAAHCLRHRQEVVFELFARVTYSSRETLQRRQYFQFLDLFKDQQPYPAGILSDWRVGSQLDRQSSAFLGTNTEPRICRCMCKPIRVPKITSGLSLIVLSIRETDWAQITWAKKVICGGSDDAA